MSLRYLAMGLIVGFLSLAGLRSAPADAAPSYAPSSLPATLQQTCLANGTVRVVFGWVPSFGSQQWLDLSQADNGFAPGTYVGVGPLGGDVGSFTWDGLAPGRTHFARVNTNSFLGWESSAKSAFVTRNCGFSSAALVAPIVPEACDAATFNWAPPNPGSAFQYLDLSTSNNGFISGTFVGVGPFGPNASSYFWTRLRPGTRHYWRVNAWTGSSWVTSAIGSFSTPCASPRQTTGGGGGGTCHPSYVGACLRIGAGDYDCAGGSGNGPNYTGRVIVVGPDVFDLDRDGDGVGCE